MNEQKTGWAVFKTINQTPAVIAAQHVSGITTGSTGTEIYLNAATSPTFTVTESLYAVFEGLNNPMPLAAVADKLRSFGNVKAAS